MGLLLDIIANPTILAILGGVIAMVMGFLKGSSSGKAKERMKQMEHDRKVRQANDETIDEADRARRNAGADDIMSDDGFRRD